MIHHPSSTAQKNINTAVAIATLGCSKLMDPHTYSGPLEGFLGDAARAA
jgi:hypothetical protein